MTHLRRSLLPLALALLVALAAVACTVDAAHEQSQVAEGFEPATHPPAWDQGQNTAHCERGQGRAGETERWPTGG
jgi:hypothetical protein